MGRRSHARAHMRQRRQCGGAGSRGVNVRRATPTHDFSARGQQQQEKATGGRKRRPAGAWLCTNYYQLLAWLRAMKTAWCVGDTGRGEGGTPAARHSTCTREGPARWVALTQGRPGRLQRRLPSQGASLSGGAVAPAPAWARGYSHALDKPRSKSGGNSRWHGGLLGEKAACRARRGRRARLNLVRPRQQLPHRLRLRRLPRRRGRRHRLPPRAGARAEDVVPRELAQVRPAHPLCGVCVD